MSALARGLLLAVASLAAVCVLVVAGLLLTLDRKALTNVLSRQTLAATGRSLTLDKPLGLSLLPAPALVAEGVSLANAPWGSRPDMLRVKRVEFRLDLLALLSGRLEVARLRVSGLDLILETGTDGQANWVFGDAGEPAEAVPGGAAFEFDLHHASIEDAHITRRSARTGFERRLDLARLALVPASGGWLSLQAEGSGHGKRFELAGRIGSIRDLVRGRAPYPVEVAARLPGTTLVLEGVFGRPPGGQGMDLKVSVQVQDLAATGALLGEKLPQAAFGLSARLREAARIINVEDIDLAGKAGRITGRLAIPTWGRARVEGEFAAGPLDFRESFPPVKQKRAAGGRVFSAEKLPLDLLRAVDASISFKAERLVLPNGSTLDAISVPLALDGGRLSMAPIGFEAGGGKGEARVSVVARDKAPAAFALSVRARKLGAGAVVGRPQGITGGSTDVDVQLAGRGNSVRELMAGLDGSARIVVGEAQVKAEAIDYMGQVLSPALDALNPARRVDPETHVECAVLNLPVKRGVVEVDDSVAFETDRLGVLAAGSVDLRSEQIDLAARPSVKQGVSFGAGTVAQAVKLGGTLAEPALTVNPLGAAVAGATVISTVASAVATGGLSLLGQALFDRAFPDEPCKTARGKEVPPRKKPATNQQAKEESSGGFLDGIKRLFE